MICENPFLQCVRMSCFLNKLLACCQDLTFFLCCHFSSSDILAEERQLSQDLVQSSKKNREFRSIFQHVQTAQLKMCPSELFAQHIVAIVHHIKCESNHMTYCICFGHNIFSSSHDLLISDMLRHIFVQCINQLS